ncbi:transmembrane protein 74B-like [Gigantopelta aegis]|uniref:transmembrane protein 74B-like n=1 Tax=Gigantopelta aegis TaxID=1735272 RepID=UPI001B889D1E|nr:transmembrane protein 74B-like [Gigantopelta aegis]XP_041360202.1 transmembrane protein 74B-like [Gigantopelta aegis]XP_041360203.1 transmembrane protein 74B-like [Gigantopelta aegis]
MSEDGCCSNAVYLRDTADRLMLLAMALVFVGLIISTVGYVIPRDYQEHPGISAKESEAMNIYYAELSARLDICVVVGMALIAVGGLLTSAVFMKTVVCNQREREDDDVEIRAFRRLDSNSRDSRQSYGTVDNR